MSKPVFIKEKLEQYNCPVIWIDVDTVFRRYPEAFYKITEEQVDVAFSSSVPNIAGMKASPLYFSTSESSRFFLDEWINRCDIVLNEMKINFDHEVLFGVVQSCIENTRFGILPPEYCVWPHEVNENTVIEMGLSDAKDKIELLKEMGIAGELLKIQTVGIL